jgi:hypothetical protein
MKNAIFWDVTPCGFRKNRRFEGTYRLRRHRIIIFLRRVLRVLVIAKVVFRSLIHVILIMEAKRSSETSVLTRVTRRNIPEECILNVIIML